MKLYTEEQLKDAIWTLVHSFADGKDILEKSINSFTPIELPSDEEIEKKFTIGTATKTSYPHMIEGAKWMKEQIQKKRQEQLLSEIMQADEKDGLYDENR